MFYIKPGKVGTNMTALLFGREHRLFEHSRYGAWPRIAREPIQIRARAISKNNKEVHHHSGSYKIQK